MKEGIRTAGMAMAADDRRCPTCRDIIKRSAVRCKWCGHRFLAEAVRPAPARSHALMAGAALLVVTAFVGFGVIYAKTSKPDDALVKQAQVPAVVSAPEPNGQVQYQVLAKENMNAVLKDSASAKYKNVRVYHDQQSGYVFCGQVNAKNAFGGYTGFERFVASPAVAATEGMVDDFPTLWNTFCKPTTDQGQTWF